MKDIIDKFIEIRKARGISQKSLAEITGLKAPAIARIEHKHIMPTIPMLNRMLNALDLELAIVDSYASPKEIGKYLKNLSHKRINVGRSGDNVFVFGDKYLLKISDNLPSLRSENEKSEWLNQYIKGPKTIAYKEEGGRGYLLREYLKGHTLIEQQYLDNPNRLISILTEIISILRSLDDKDCPFISKDSAGNDFVHGDLCLPNIIVDDNDEFMGFVDVNNCGKGDKEYDYYWLLWSMEHNLKTNKHNHLLLEQINYEVDAGNYLRYVIGKMINDNN